MFSDSSKEQSSVSSGKRPAEFKEKYRRLAPIGSGGLSWLYEGVRRADNLPVAIKYIPTRAVSTELVMHDGKQYSLFSEVALMLKAAGLSGSVGRSSVVSLLDWYLVGGELILVTERPLHSCDLHKYLQHTGGHLEEREAKMILRQLVDAAMDMRSKGVFHGDMTLQNVLLDFSGWVPRVRIINLGCGTFSTESSQHSYSGTLAFAPPEWFLKGTYSCGPTTVWQLGGLFHAMLNGQGRFSSATVMYKGADISRELSADCKMILEMCLARDPAQRATLEELQACPALNRN
nr:PREDICTED: serine/threonine-protein kinase pim-2-like [Stegastes partitus]